MGMTVGMRSPYDHYRRVAAETADPLELVIMLYRGAITNLAGAEDAIRMRDVERSHRLLVRAQDIVAELQGTLNLDAGDLAHNLRRLYDYMQQRLLEANLRKEVGPAAEVRAMLLELLSTWEELARRYRTGTALAHALGAA